MVWTSDSFTWNATVENAALRLELSDVEAGDCKARHAYRASGSVTGWDHFVAVESGEDSGWYFSGSAWHDGRVHVGGALDSSDFVEPHRADGWMHDQWSTDPFVGDLVIHVASLHLATKGDDPTFKFSLQCKGDAVVSAVSTGEEAALFDSDTVTGGAGVSGKALVAGGGATVRSGADWDTQSAGVGLVLAGFGQNVGRFEVTGPQGAHEVLVEPAVDPFAGFYHSATLKAPGSFSYVLDEVAASSGVNGALLGLTPLAKDALTT